MDLLFFFDLFKSLLHEFALPFLSLLLVMSHPVAAC
jgi:hypothetical protein